MNDNWYWYKLGGWEIAVCAINKRDADAHIKRRAYGAEYRGSYPPPTMAHPSTATAMVTPRMDEQVRAYYRRERGEE